MEIINEEKVKTRQLIEQIIDGYLGYNYTKDPEYISVIIPV